MRDRLKNLIRRQTPTPKEKEVYNMGIQERRFPQHIAGQYLYDLAKNSTIVRSCLVQLKTEIFRRGYEWVKAFEFKCMDCEYEHHKHVTECMACESTNLRTLILNSDNMQNHFSKIT